MYETTPAQMFTRYIVPGENGSRSDCDWICFRREDDTGLCIVPEGSKPLSFSALLHSASELEAAKHTCELESRENGMSAIHCSIDHELMGVGGDTR